MKRYDFLLKHEVYQALNKARDALLAAKDGNDVNELLEGLFTDEERLKIGRRIQIAEEIRLGRSYAEIIENLHVGVNTINTVYRNLNSHPRCFKLIFERSRKVENDYNEKKYRLVGESQLVHKRKEYTGITRKDIKR